MTNDFQPVDLTDVDTDDLFEELARRYNAAVLVVSKDVAVEDSMRDETCVRYSGGHLTCIGMAHIVMSRLTEGHSTHTD